MAVADRSTTHGFLESLTLLKRLHFLSLADNDQGEKGDQVREEMELPWRRLNDVERRPLEGLSEDLYSIGEMRSAPEHLDNQAAKSFEEATKLGDWDTALEVLRRHESGLPPADVAAMRGVAWGSLGHHDIAGLFFGEAVRLRPDNSSLMCLYLRSLLRSGDRDLAKQEATRLALTANTAIDLLLAADVLFDCEQLDSADADIDSLRRIARLADRAMAAWNTAPVDEAMSWVACAGFLSGAICFELIGEHSRSDELYEIAETLLPGSVASASRVSQRTNAEFVATMLQAKHAVDAQLLPVS